MADISVESSSKSNIPLSEETPSSPQTKEGEIAQEILKEQAQLHAPSSSSWSWVPSFVSTGWEKTKSVGTQILKSTSNFGVGIVADLTLKTYDYFAIKSFDSTKIINECKEKMTEATKDPRYFHFAEWMGGSLAQALWPSQKPTLEEKLNQLPGGLHDSISNFLDKNDNFIKDIIKTNVISAMGHLGKKFASSDSEVPPGTSLTKLGHNFSQMIIQETERVSKEIEKRPQERDDIIKESLEKVTHEILAAAFPQGADSIELPDLGGTVHFLLRQWLYPVVEQKMTQFIQTTYEKTLGSEEKTRKESETILKNLTGLNELDALCSIPSTLLKRELDKQFTEENTLTSKVLLNLIPDEALVSDIMKAGKDLFVNPDNRPIFSPLLSLLDTSAASLFAQFGSKAVEGKEKVIPSEFLAHLLTHALKTGKNQLQPEMIKDLDLNHFQLLPTELKATQQALSLNAKIALEKDPKAKESLKKELNQMIQEHRVPLYQLVKTLSSHAVETVGLKDKIDPDVLPRILFDQFGGLLMPLLEQKMYEEALGNTLSGQCRNWTSEILEKVKTNYIDPKQMSRFAASMVLGKQSSGSQMDKLQTQIESLLKNQDDPFVWDLTEKIVYAGVIRTVGNLTQGSDQIYQLAVLQEKKGEIEKSIRLINDEIEQLKQLSSLESYEREEKRNALETKSGILVQEKAAVELEIKNQLAMQAKKNSLLDQSSALAKLTMKAFTDSDLSNNELKALREISALHKINTSVETINQQLTVLRKPPLKEQKKIDLLVKKQQELQTKKSDIEKSVSQHKQPLIKRLNTISDGLLTMAGWGEGSAIPIPEMIKSDLIPNLLLDQTAELILLHAERQKLVDSMSKAPIVGLEELRKSIPSFVTNRMTKVLYNSQAVAVEINQLCNLNLDSRSLALLTKKVEDLRHKGLISNQNFFEEIIRIAESGSKWELTPTMMEKLVLVKELMNNQPAVVQSLGGEAIAQDIGKICNLSLDKSLLKDLGEQIGRMAKKGKVTENELYGEILKIALKKQKKATPQEKLTPEMKEKLISIVERLNKSVLSTEDLGVAINTFLKEQKLSTLTPEQRTTVATQIYDLVSKQEPKIVWDFLNRHIELTALKILERIGNKSKGEDIIEFALENVGNILSHNLSEGSEIKNFENIAAEILTMSDISMKEPIPGLSQVSSNRMLPVLKKEMAAQLYGEFHKTVLSRLSTDSLKVPEEFSSMLSNYPTAFIYLFGIIIQKRLLG